MNMPFSSCLSGTGSHSTASPSGINSFIFCVLAFPVLCLFLAFFRVYAGSSSGVFPRRRIFIGEFRPRARWILSYYFIIRIIVQNTVFLFRLCGVFSFSKTEFGHHVYNIFRRLAVIRLLNVFFTGVFEVFLETGNRIEYEFLMPVERVKQRIEYGGFRMRRFYFIVIPKQLLFIVEIFKYVHLTRPFLKPCTRSCRACRYAKAYRQCLRHQDPSSSRRGLQS